MSRSIKHFLKQNQNSIDSSCIEPGYTQVCSGHGICTNGTCHCDSLGDADPLYRYSGKYCEECPYCNGQRCDKIFPCLNCKNAAKLGCDATCELNFVFTATVVANKSLDEKACFVEDQEGCFVRFKYVYENESLTVFGNYQKDCYDGYRSKFFSLKC